MSSVGVEKCMKRSSIEPVIEGRVALLVLVREWLMVVVGQSRFADGEDGRGNVGLERPFLI
jgi:hypothetical protein